MAIQKNHQVEISRLYNRAPIEWENAYQVCSLLQSEIAAAIRGGEKISHIANRCKLAHTTVSNIGYGQTKEPRASTTLILLHHFGYKVTIS